jgi:hypothetical protein
MKTEENRKSIGDKKGKTSKNSCVKSISKDEYHALIQSSKKKKNKYGAKRKQVDGINFHSTWEADRYSELRIMEKAGLISQLKLQVKYPLKVNGAIVSNYIADFVYYDRERNEITEDAKGVKTPEYRLKKKLLLAIYGIEIFESYRR